jgi:hypothetical protein
MFNIAQSAKFDLPALITAMTASRLPTLIRAVGPRKASQQVYRADLRST